MHRHIGLGNAQPLRDEIARALRRLEPAPDLASAAVDACRRGWRLHGGVRQMRQVILGDHTARRGRQGVRTAMFVHHLAWSACGSLQFGPVAARIVAAVGPVLPDDVEGITALACSPGAVGNDCNPTQRIEGRWRIHRCDAHDALDARNLHRPAGIEMPHPPPKHRRTGDHGMQQARQLDVDAVDRSARNDCPGVHDTELTLADIAEFGRCLQTQGLPARHRKPCRCSGQLAIVEAATGGVVNHPVIARHDLADRYRPARCRRRLQHLAGGRPAATHRFEEMPEAA